MATSIFRFYRFVVSGVAIAAATLSLSAAGQATINPLYLDGIDKCVDKTSMEEVKLPSAGIYTADKADKAKWIAAKACFLAKLNAKFPIYPTTEAEMSLDYYSLLRKRLAPESDEKDKIRQLPGQRFKDDANALHYRRTLLRLFETVRSGGTSDFVVVPYRDAGKAEGKTSASFCDGFTPASSKPYVPLSNPEKDDEMIRYFLRKDSMDFLLFKRPDTAKTKDDKTKSPTWENIRTASCAGVEVNLPPTTPRVSGLVSYVENLAEDKDLTVVCKNDAQKYPDKCRLKPADKLKPEQKEFFTFKRKFRLVESREGFTDDEKNKLKISLERDENAEENPDSLKINFAAGVVWEREFQNYSSYLTPFFAYHQEQTEEVIDVYQLPENALPKRKNREVELRESLALANVHFGIEYRRKYKPAAADCNLKNLEKRYFIKGSGRSSSIYTPDCSALPGAEHAATFQLITDNYSDQKGMQLEYSFKPSITTPALNWLPGYRYPMQFGVWENEYSNNLSSSNIFQNAYIEWDAELILDTILYHTPPLNLDSLMKGDRRDDKYLRAGLDLAAQIGLPNYFSPNLDGARVAVKGELELREGILPGNKSANKRVLSLILKDVVNDRLDFALTYTAGRNLINFSPTETIGLEVKSKF